VTTLGSCLLANDIPFEGLAKEIVERRVQGQSWKQIGEELNIGSPGAARAKFTKLTGIKDYKVKGQELLKLVKEGPGIPEAPTIPKTPSKSAAQKAATEAKKVDVPKVVQEDWRLFGQKQINLIDDESIRAIYRQAWKNTDWSDINAVKSFFDATSTHVKKPANLDFWVEQKGVVQKAKAPLPKTKAPDVTVSADKYNWDLSFGELPKIDDIDSDTVLKIRKLHDQKNGYMAISQKVPGVSTEQIDRVVARHELQKAGYSPYEALKAKPSSITLQKAVADKVMDATKKGLSAADISGSMKIPKSIVDDILRKKGNWSLPFGKKLPEFNPEELKLPDYQTATAKVPSNIKMGDKKPGTGSGAGEVDEALFPRGTNQQLQQMRLRLWNEARDAADRHLPEHHVRSYTGSTYHSVNTSLRNRAGRGSATVVKHMDDAMYSVDEAFSVTRGMGADGLGLAFGASDDVVKQLVGKVIQDKGFISTSTKPVFGNKVRLNIEVPEGARGHWAKPISIHSSEDEFILARGTRFLVLGVDTTGNTWKLRVRVIV